MSTMCSRCYAFLGPEIPQMDLGCPWCAWSLDIVRRCPNIFGGSDDFLFECRSGWSDILDHLMVGLEGLANSTHSPHPNLRIAQVKEKFGVLRVYVSGAAEYDAKGYPTDVGSLIGEAYEMSGVTCELCGERGELRVEGLKWIRTLCERHYQENAFGQCKSCGHDFDATASYIDDAEGQISKLRAELASVNQSLTSEIASWLRQRASECPSYNTSKLICGLADDLERHWIAGPRRRR